MPKPRTPGATTVRTTLVVPTSLWKRAKARAVVEERDLRDVLLDALRAYLAQPPKEKGERHAAK